MTGRAILTRAWALHQRVVRLGTFPVVFSCVKSARFSIWSAKSISNLDFRVRVSILICVCFTCRFRFENTRAFCVNVDLEIPKLMSVFQVCLKCQSFLFPNTISYLRTRLTHGIHITFATNQNLNDISMICLTLLHYTSSNCRFGERRMFRRADFDTFLAAICT